MTITDLLSTKTAKLSLVFFCIALLLIAVSPSITNAVDTKSKKGNLRTTTGGPATGGAATGSGATGGPATGGPATGGPATGGPATGGAAAAGSVICNGTTCNIYLNGGPAAGGQAIGGAATNNGGNTGDSAESSSPLIDPYTSYDVVGLVQKGKDLYKSGMYNEALTYFDRALDVDPNNKEALDYKALYLAQKTFSLLQKAKSNIQQAHKDPMTVNQTRR